MSRIQNYSFSGYPSSYDTTNSSTAGATNPNRGCTNSGSTTYAQFTSNSKEERNYYYNFTTNIPSFATITDVLCYIRARTSATGTNYMGYTQLCHGTTNKGTETQINTISTGTSISLTTGSWDISEINDIKIRITPNRYGNNRYVRFYGANLIINYSITWYSISTNSSITGVSIISSANEIESGNSITLTTNASSLSNIKIIDNDNDITNNFTGTSGNYTYTLSNINNDHVISVSKKSSSSNRIYHKENGWIEYKKANRKVENAWAEQTISSDLFDSGTIYISK